MTAISQRLQAPAPRLLCPQTQIPAEPAPAPADPEAPGDQVDLSQLVDVGHQREMRGAWVATVWNINFPSSTKTDAETQKKELKAMLDRLQGSGFNAIFFQVRPEGDAVYLSDLEPATPSASRASNQGKKAV